MRLDWEIWLDNHFSSVLAKRIADHLGWTVKSSFVLKLHGLDDEKIFLRAKAAGKVVLVTRDTDFSSYVERFGAPPKILNLKMANLKTSSLFEKLKGVLERHIRMLADFNQNILELYIDNK